MRTSSLIRLVLSMAVLLLSLAFYISLWTKKQAKTNRFIASISDIKIDFQRKHTINELDQLRNRHKIEEIVEKSLDEFGHKRRKKFDISKIKRIYQQTITPIPNNRKIAYENNEIGTTESTINEKLPSKMKYCNIYSWNQTVSDAFKCLPMKVDPPTTICLHNPKKDIHLSAGIIGQGVWEPFTVKYIQDILRSDEKMGFIDLGSNLGVFSLIAAQMGHSVLSVEPFSENIVRFHRSVELGHLQDRITLLQNAISNERSRGKLKLSIDNQGDTRIEKRKHEGRHTSESNSSVVDIITMDDLLEVVTFKRAVIKMDIQGYEHRAILGGGKLLDELDVPYIFMEWILMNKLFNDDPYTLTDDNRIVQELAGLMLSHEFSPVALKTERELVRAAFTDLTRRGYNAFSLQGEPLHGEHLNAWPVDVVWRHKSALRRKN